MYQKENKTEPNKSHLLEKIFCHKIDWFPRDCIKINNANSKDY